MAINIFGFSIARQQPEQESGANNVVAPDSYDGSFHLDSGSVYGGFLSSYTDFSGSAKTDEEFIKRYRSMSLFPEVDMAIEDICNDAIVSDVDDEPVKLDLENSLLPDPIKARMYQEFERIKELFNFNEEAYGMFKRWYIDSKLFYYVMIDEQNPQLGIQELRPIDPLKIKKVKKVNKIQNGGGYLEAPTVGEVEEFYLYTNRDTSATFQTGASGVRLTKDSVLYCHSGLIDSTSKRVVGYLQKAIRPLNMLRQLEDAAVVYRISRAPERRIFYVDVGNMPTQKAQQYIEGLAKRYRNKLTYDQSTGSIREDRDHFHMLEDFFLPRKEGGKGTEITTLPGGTNLGEMRDVEYMLEKLYRALNVPPSRLAADSGFNMGRSAEITRDEVKFSKFIQRLRNKFSALLVDALRIQLSLVGVMGIEDFDQIRNRIKFKYNSDSHYSELKQVELMREKLSIAAGMEPYIGRYFSNSYIRKEVFGLTESEISRNFAEIQQEMQTGEIQPPQPEETGEQQ